MAKASRRRILQTATAVCASSILTAGRVGAAEPLADSGQVFHVFAFQWKPGATADQKDRAKKNISAFQGVIPGLIQTHVGPNISPRGKGYTFGGIMQFKDEASLDAYFQHPAHLTLLKWLVPLIDAVEIDLRA